VIRFQSVYKSYEHNAVLKGIDFHVERGETKIILGGSGSGKSTILKLLLGLEKPDAGAIVVEGVDITELSELELLPIRSKIGMVFQEGALFDSLTVGENVAYRLRENGKMTEIEILGTVQQLLGFVDMEKAIDFLRGKGIEIAREPVDMGTSIRGEIRDPDGLIIELRKWKKLI
jgi:phospholipid/cholesterol/gamma-HCH transport system ATP-binding protein